VTAHHVVAAGAARDGVSVPAALTGPADGPLASHFALDGAGRVCVAPGVAVQDLEPGSVDVLRIGCAAPADAIVAGLPGLIDRSPKLRILLEYDADRCHDAAAMLSTLAARFPLRFVDGDSRAKPITIADLLGSKRVATLYLSNADPC
jgi:hypothetical protein